MAVNTDCPAKGEATSLGAVFDAVVNVHMDWMRDERLFLSQDESHALARVGIKGDGGIKLVNTTVPAAAFKSGLYTANSR